MHEVSSLISDTIWNSWVVFWPFPPHKTIMKIEENILICIEIQNMFESVRFIACYWETETKVSNVLIFSQRTYSCFKIVRGQQDSCPDNVLPLSWAWLRFRPEHTIMRKLVTVVAFSCLCLSKIQTGVMRSQWWPVIIIMKITQCVTENLIRHSWLNHNGTRSSV